MWYCPELANLCVTYEMQAQHTESLKIRLIYPGKNEIIKATPRKCVCGFCRIFFARNALGKP